MRRRPLLAALALAVAACTGPASIVHGDGIDAASLPADQRADYAVFADRCSKCHALSRPLSSGIVDDAFWVRYVEKMRLQPASGISPEDVAPILRFLHRFSEEQRRLKASAERGKDAGP